jgi:plastocyanin
MRARGRRGGFFLHIFTLFAGLLVLPVHADFVVDVTSSSFFPNPVNISAGEYVAWVCTDFNGPYDIGSENFEWEAGTLFNYGDYVVLQFLSPGSYPYIDSTFDNGGVGSLNVVANVNPTVTITTPTNGTVFTAPATFNFNAVASDTDADGLVVLRLFLSTNLLSQTMAAPLNPPGRAFTYTPGMTNSTMLTNLAAGTYTLFAIGTDNARSNTLAFVNITVQNSSAITLENATLQAGQLKFNVTGLTAGKTNVLEATTNISSATNWVSLATNVAAGSSASYTNAVGAGRRFFRVLQLP